MCCHFLLVDNMKKQMLSIGILLMFFLGNSGCINDTTEESFDISHCKLTSDDLKKDFEKISEDHVTEPYTVSEGKLLEGIQVKEKYEIYFVKNTSHFIIQQIALLESEQETSDLMDTLLSHPIIPGLQRDWNFSISSIESIGDEVILLQNESIIERNAVTVYLLAFYIDDVVNIFVSSSVDKASLVGYAKLIEDRITV